jgi:hypothetical protein
VEDAFGTVVFVVVAVGVLVAVITLVGSGRSYRQIGRGGLTHDDAPAASPATEREDEIRQMLVARSARRERRGEEPLDIEAELAAIDRPPDDADLRDEVRAVVVAGNRRRVRAGKEPLDVDAEVERRIRELT